MTEIAAQQTISDDKPLNLENSLVTREELDEFKRLAFKEYGVTLTDEEAFEQATALLRLFDAMIDEKLATKRQRVNMNNGQK